MTLTQLNLKFLYIVPTYFLESGKWKSTMTVEALLAMPGVKAGERDEVCVFSVFKTDDESNFLCREKSSCLWRFLQWLGILTPICRLSL